MTNKNEPVRTYAEEGTIGALCDMLTALEMLIHYAYCDMPTEERPSFKPGSPVATFLELLAVSAEHSPMTPHERAFFLGRLLSLRK